MLPWSPLCFMRQKTDFPNQTSNHHAKDFGILLSQRLLHLTSPTKIRNKLCEFMPMTKTLKTVLHGYGKVKMFLQKPDPCQSPWRCLVTRQRWHWYTGRHHNWIFTVTSGHKPAWCHNIHWRGFTHFVSEWIIRFWCKDSPRPAGIFNTGCVFLRIWWTWTWT